MKRPLNPKHWLFIVCHLVMILIGFLLCSGPNPNTLSFAIGGSVIAAGFCGEVIFVYVFISEETNDRLNLLSEFGMVNAFDARSVRIKQEYVKRLADARDRIDVVGFGLSAFREDFLNDLKDWKQRANVRILLIDPEFPDAVQSYASQRDKEEKNQEGKIARDVRKFIADVAPLIGKTGGHEFSVRLYRCLPSLNIFRIDDELFWGPYLVGEQSRNSPTFIVKRGGILFDRFSKQFQQIWDSKEMSRPIPAEMVSSKA
jgi:hypothetical protein